ncbi:MAG: substrate-binding domain-containing protein [Bacteroidota bacterium]|nr:substrate-binding domain-containing protein [Bacteroidota bacterium]MDP4206506.1 substrate-binding domain-containing protein [Bacteroidota bacterium]
MKKVSINDIAARLGVSPTLVSLALNGKGKEYRIRDEICKKVLDMAAELNYQPNTIAKGLRTGKTQTLGVIVADIANPFFGRLCREIETEAELMGYKVIFCSSDEDATRSKRQLEMLLQSQVDGLIISPPVGSNEQIQFLADAGFPYVLIDRYFPDIDSNFIIVDNFEASFNATNFLISKGYKRIGFLTINEDLVTMHNRTEGYLTAINNSDLKIGDTLLTKLPFSHDGKDVRQAIMDLLQREGKIDALIFSSSKIGLMGLEAIADIPLKVPQDIAIVSFDDPDSFKICFTPISAIAQPLSEMGKRSVQLLVQQIKKRKKTETTEKVVLKTEFIVRKSC